MNLDELERLAKAATPGPWEFRATKDSGGIKFVVAPNAPAVRGNMEFIPADCSHGYNGKFIAAANPDTILKLIAVTRAATEALKDMSEDGQLMYGDFVRLNEALAALED